MDGARNEQALIKNAKDSANVIIKPTGKGTAKMTGLPGKLKKLLAHKAYFDMADRDIEELFPELYESLNEANRISPADNKVIISFTEQKPGESRKLKTDGKTLDGLWMGGNNIAQWKSNKIHFNDLGSKAAETVQKAIKREAPKNQIVESKTFTGKEIADKMRKEPEAFGGRNLINRVAQMKTVTAKELDDMLPDYVAGGDIQQLFKENTVNETLKSLINSIVNKDYHSAKINLQTALENKKKQAIQNKLISEKKNVNSIDQLKKDQYVKVDKGPHKNEWHLIIHVDKNRGTANVVPVEVKVSKYRHGAIAIRPENVVELSNTKPSFVMKNLPPARY
jgi:transcription antitermination factor NusG